MICEICKDTKFITINREEDIVEEPCPNCATNIYSCKKDHLPITFRATLCPLCVVLRQIHSMELELVKLRREHDYPSTTRCDTSQT